MAPERATCPECGITTRDLHDAVTTSGERVRVCQACARGWKRLIERVARRVARALPPDEERA